MFGKKEKKSDGSKEKKNGINIGAGISATKQLYEANVAKRALNRAGKNKNLKGHINELLTVDQLNRKPGNILKGKKAVLTKSPIAVRDDIVLKQNGKIIGRMQLKDTTSKGGIKKTVKQVEQHHYKGTKLVGTKETTQMYAKELEKNDNIKQKMYSNGISSNQTELIAKKALGEGGNKTTSKIIKESSKTGLNSAVITAGVETIKNVPEVKNGNKTVKGAIGTVANETAINAASAAAGDATATAVTIAISAAAPVAASVAPIVGTAAGVGASMATDKVIRKGESAVSEQYNNRRNQN